MAQLPNPSPNRNPQSQHRFPFRALSPSSSFRTDQSIAPCFPQVLREELEWLNYFPAGFKLNVPLTHTLGSLTLVGMDAYSSIVGELAQWEVRNPQLCTTHPRVST